MAVKIRWCVLAEGISDFQDNEFEKWLAAAPPSVAMRVESTLVDETYDPLGLDPVKLKNRRAIQALFELFPCYSIEKIARWFGLGKECLELVKVGRRNFCLLELTRIIIVLGKKRPVPQEVIAKFRALQKLAMQKRK